MIGLSTIPWHDLVPYILVGFFAQLIDGAFGLAFGVFSNTALVAFGLSPATASAAVRTAESFASGVSGLAHAAQRNVDWSLFARLVLPGIAGSLLGVWVLMHLFHPVLRPLLFVYVSAVGIYLVWRGPRRAQTYRPLRFAPLVGLAGGFLDASGSGGWGPVVTSQLMAQGTTPRVAVGTTDAAEFFVTVTTLAAFIGTLGLASFTIATSGLLLGSVVAAPLGAYLAKRLPPRFLIVVTGTLLIVTGVFGILSLAFEPIPTFPRF